MINRLFRCKEGKRCGLIYACKSCGDLYQKRRFVYHTKELNYKFKNFYYVVIGCDKFLTLRDNIEKVKAFLSEFSKLNSRKRGVFACLSYLLRLEVSFGKYGFYPHINILIFDVDIEAFLLELYQILNDNKLSIKSIKKNNDINTFKSILWYIFKYNKMEWRKAMAVQIALKCVKTLRYSNDFSFTNVSMLDDEIFPYLDMSFLSSKKLRSKRETRIIKKVSEKRKKLNVELKTKLKNLKRCACGCGMALDTNRKYYSKECYKLQRQKTKKV